MHRETETAPQQPDPSSRERGAYGSDLVFAALAHLRGDLPRDRGASGSPTLAWQKESLCEWADGMGLLLNPDDLPSKVLRGGQEHDLFHDEKNDRIFKITRNGVFGLSPGIELALVSSSEDGRRFHLWEACPLEYLERLHLQNQLVPGLNALEGVINQADDMSIAISQPRFELVAVTQKEIDTWFLTQGFQRVTEAGYYREMDNLGVFDAHEKNVIRASEILIPFDVIPCHPSGGFLQFISETLAAGHRIQAVRRVTTTPRR